MEESKKERVSPPYVAYRTLKNFLRSLTQMIPSRIDKSAMASLSGGAQAQLLHAMKYLNLITAEGAPTEKLPPLVKSEGADHQKQLRELITAAYPFLKGGSLDLNKATHQQLEEEFKKLAGGDTVRKCIGFFVPAAKDAGIALSPFIKEPGKRSPSNGRVKKARPKAAKSDATTVDRTADVQNPIPDRLSWHQLLLSKFPSFDPAWPDDVKTNWFKSFNELMQQGKKEN